MTKQAVIFVHGIGKQSAGFSTKCQDKIKAQLAKEGHAASDIIFKEATWAPVLSGPQEDLWNLVKNGDDTNDLDMVKLRKFMISFAGDAIAYQNDGVGAETYKKIHDVISSNVAEIQAQVGDESCEFTFVAHSLGTVITSDWLWDQQASFTATNLFTLGSPIALWLLRYGSAALADKVISVGEHGAWINILDDEDIIGYPLRPINAHYQAAVDMDYITEIGSLLSSGNPLSHVGYWTDRNVYKPIAKKLALDYKRISSGVSYDRSAYLSYIRGLWKF